MRLAAQTKTTVVMSVIKSDTAGCHKGGVGCIAMRSIMMNGAEVGKNESPIARFESGARKTAKDPMYPTIMSIITNTIGADKYIKDNSHGGDVQLDLQ